MMQRIVFLLVLVSIVASEGRYALRENYQPESIPVPVKFITEKDEFLPGEQTMTYRAALCGGCQFDGLMARFAVNLKNTEWNDDKGDTINLIIKDSQGNAIASNVISKTPVPDFNFTYSSKYGDLYAVMTTGPAPSFTYTLALSFDYKIVAETQNCARRWQMTAIEYASVLKHKATSTANDVGELIPIFKTETTQTIKTMDLLRLRLDYCFGPHPQYNITITTVADDRLSGFATYACVKTYVQQQGKCDTRTPYKDISGGAANFVSVHLNGPQDYGPIEVIVRGDGRFGGNNLFTLAASAPGSP